MKPGGDCNRGHIPKALEHVPPTLGPQQAPVTHKPNGSVGKKDVYIYNIIPKRGGGIISYIYI